MLGVMMLRVRLTFIGIAMIAGCTSRSVSPTEQVMPPVLKEPTITPSASLNIPATEATVIENTLLPDQYTIQEYPVPAGTHPHDVAPAPDGTVWYTAQNTGNWAGLTR
jgi:streptogramin lyase